MFCKDKLIARFEIPPDWTYRGEGNCNVVLSLPKSRQILRIRKIDRPDTLIERLIVWISDIFYWYSGKALREELRDLKFYTTIIRPLVGEKYTSEATQVILSRKQIKFVENELNKHRPDFRKSKILQYGRAALFTDFAYLCQDDLDNLPFRMKDDTFAVEIKPKQGWKPLSEKHFPKCLYCMNQHLKMDKGRIKKISEYCPEDLFSGNPQRMKNAIKSLIKCPQNNFRIFKNGQLCYGVRRDTEFDNIVRALFNEEENESNRLQDEFCDLIQKCLTSRFLDENSVETCEQKLFCEWNKVIQESNFNTALPKGCVLEKILSVQMLDVEGSNYYNKLLQKGHFGDWDYINMTLTKLNDTKTCLNCSIMMLGDIQRLGSKLDLAFVPYVISAIAKDCSLMITLRKVEGPICDDFEMPNLVSTRYGRYLVNIGVFDLYPKPLATVRKHYKRNKDVYQAYMKARKKS